MLMRLKKKIRQAMYLPFMARDIIFCMLHHLSWHHSWRFWGMPFVQCSRRSCIKIGTHFTACSSATHNSIGVIQKVMLKINSPTATIIIGDHVGMSGCSIAASERIEIGNYVLIGSGCLITDSDAHPIDPIQRRHNCNFLTRPVVIEEDVFIGARSIILKGVRIGRGSVIGAGSVVTHNIPSMVIAAGNPCRVIREIVGKDNTKQII
jgi:acetyltransferase-like isoleucine patch superfamily enzyme